MKKVSITVRIDEDIYQKLKEISKDGYGLQSYIVNVALRQYFQLTETEKAPANWKVRQLIEVLKNYEKISQRELRKLIEDIAGIDKRTVEKYINYLLRWNIIEKEATGAYKVRRPVL